MKASLLITDLVEIHGELESMAAFCMGQRDLMLKVASLCGTDRLVEAADVARTVEAASVWAAQLADRLNTASETIFSQVELMGAAG